MQSETLRIDENHWRARRVPLVDGDRLPWESMEPGDYCGPTTAYTGGVPAIFFLLPVARDEDAHGSLRSLHHVCSPPHTFAEMPDGSVEVRASIGIAEWHCFLDGGNLWRHP